MAQGGGAHFSSHAKEGHSFFMLGSVCGKWGWGERGEILTSASCEMSKMISMIGMPAKGGRGKAMLTLGREQSKERNQKGKFGRLNSERKILKRKCEEKIRQVEVRRGIQKGKVRRANLGEKTISSFADGQGKGRGRAGFNNKI